MVKIHVPIVITAVSDSSLGTEMEVAIMVMEYVPSISPVMMAIVAVDSALCESLCPPSCW